jgi:hypothetical protein
MALTFGNHTMDIEFRIYGSLSFLFGQILVKAKAKVDYTIHFAHHKAKIQFLLLWQCFLTPINNEIYKKGFIFIICIIIGS